MGNNITPRDRQIIEGIAEGKHTRAIAAGFGTRPATVKVQRKNLLAKVGVHNSRDLINLAKDRGWIGDIRPARAQTKAALTPTESTVILWAAKGMSVAETGSLMEITPKTVGTHLYRARRKLGSPEAKKWQLAEVAGLAPKLEVTDLSASGASDSRPLVVRQA